MRIFILIMIKNVLLRVLPICRQPSKKIFDFFIKKILVVLKSVILLHRQKRKDILKRYLKQIFFKDSRSTK